MRIGIVLPDLPKYSETFFNYKIKGLQESGFEVIVFSSKRTKENIYFEHVGQYPVYSGKQLRQFLLLTYVLLLTFCKTPSRFIKLFKLERKDGKSISESLKTIYINAHILSEKLDWLHFGFATMALKRENVAEAIGARMGVSFRGYDINVYPLKNPGCYNKLWKKVDKVHSISSYLHDKAVSLGLSGKTKHEKITPAIDINLFKFKNEAGKFSNPIRILTVGRLNWIKDYETAISAMKILKDRGVNFIYEIIGTGKEFERLNFAVHQADLTDRVFFLGEMSHEKITEKMIQSDIYLQTSFQEGFCVSVLEAQATGLMCIVSDADGLKENVIDNVTGFVVQRRQPVKFAEKILEVSAITDEQRKEISLSARKRVEEDFQIDEQKKKFKKFFEE